MHIAILYHINASHSHSTIIYHITMSSHSYNTSYSISICHINISHSTSHLYISHQYIALLYHINSLHYYITFSRFIHIAHSCISLMHPFHISHRNIHDVPDGRCSIPAGIQWLVFLIDFHNGIHSFLVDASPLNRCKIQNCIDYFGHGDLHRRLSLHEDLQQLG